MTLLPVRIHSTQMCRCPSYPPILPIYLPGFLYTYAKDPAICKTGLILNKE